MSQPHHYPKLRTSRGGNHSCVVPGGQCLLRTQPVQPAELAIQVAQVRSSFQRVAGGPLDELFGIVPTAVTVDVLPQPPSQCPELAAAYLLKYVWMGLERFFE